MAHQIIIYTDGAASGNPGPGGFGVVLMAGPHRKELMAGFRMTTNNRMELLAVIIGLEALKQEGQQVTIYSDSRYVVDAVENQNIAITQITEGVDQISSVVQTNSATAQESAAASEELSAEAASLKRLVDGFTLARN